MSRNHQISTSANPAPPPVESYILRPPEWRGTLSSEADLGFPDFYPSRPAHGQDEDCLSELFVKQGYVSKWGISQASESFSVHGVLLKELGSQAGLARMGSTLSSLLSTRQASASSIGPSTYRLPPRYTLHDSKRLTFVADLANPLVPLHKLSKSIPHGFKGGELLEMLWSNGVSLERGVWFAKVVGASEMQRPQGKPQPPPNHYSLEWTNACTTWLKKQLAEITLPSVPRPGFSVKQAFKSILSDPQSRERWVAKWNFSCSLIRSFFAHSLLDHRNFLSWLVQQIAPANLAQIGFVSRLIEEYLEQILASGALARLMVEGVSAKTMEIVGGSAKGGAGEKLEEIKIGLARILQSTFLQAPTLFVSPKLYNAYSNLFNLVLSESPEMTLPASQAAREEPLALAVIAAMREQWEEIKRRNVGLLFMSGGGGGWSPRRQAMADINILDSICSTSDMAQISLSFFTTVPTPPPSSSSSKRASSSKPSSSAASTSTTAQAFFPTKLDILLSWSIAYAQFGAHRPSSVSTLLLHHRARHPGCDTEVQELVFKWVAESEVAAKEENREAVAETIGELMRVGIVGFAGFLMRLMSRGLTAGFREGNEPSSQLKILRSIPLYSSTSSLLSQRRVALYGLRPSTGSSDDDALAELVTQELDAAFPELAAQSVPSPNEMEDDSEPRIGSVSQLATLLGAPKFIQIDCVHRWLKKKGLSSSSDDLDLNSELLAKLLYLLEQVRDFPTMLELLFTALECPSSNSLISPIILAFKRYADVWTAMEAKGPIAEALFEKHLDLRGAPTTHRELLEVLFEMGEVGCLSEEDRTVVVNDMSMFEKSFFPSSHHPNPPPSNLDEVQMLSHELDPQAGTALATTLWYRYHAFDEWPFVVWQNVVLALALLTSAVSDPAEQLVVVDRYARFLDEVHKHIPSGLDRHLRRWFRERADQETTSDVFRGGLDGAMNYLLLQLALAGCIETVTIMDEVVLPVWKLCALRCRSSGSEAIFSSPLAVSLQSVNILATRLLLINSPSLSTSNSFQSSSSSLPPRNLEEIQRFQTSAIGCFEDSSFVKLVTHLPFVVALEVALPSGDTLAASCGTVWAGLSKHQSLKVAAFRHSGTIKEAFLRPWWPGGERSAEVSLDGRLIDALKDLISDGNQIDPTHSPTVYDWRKVVTRLTPWRWSRSVLELQLSLKQLAIRSSSESTAPEAEALLSNLTRTVFERNLSSDETDLICEGLAGTEVGPIEKFAVSGLGRLADILVSYDPSSPAAQERFNSFTDSAGNVLRVLSGTLAQARAPEGERTPFSAQDRLSEAILEMLQKLEVQLNSVHRLSSSLNPEARPEGSLSSSQLTSLLILMLRSLHVALGFSRTGIIDLWTPKAKTSMEPFLKVQMSLISMHAGTQILEEGLFALLIDTLWYYVDELPRDLRAGCIATLRTLQISEAYERHPSIPDDLRSQIKRILPYVSPDPLVENLVVSTNSLEPSLFETVKAQARPWEWIEFTDPPAPTPSHRDAYPARQVVKNNASMSLTLFQAEGTRDRLPSPSTSSRFSEAASSTMEVDKDEPWKAVESERSYADDLEGSTTFANDWARSRLRRDEEAAGGGAGDDSKSSADGSTAAAAPSPMNTVPTPAASTLPIPIASSSRSATNKRKASVSSSSTAASTKARGSTAADAVVIDDDDEPPAKVQKGRTGGKTTGGKTTAAKAPAGKKGRKKGN